MVDIQVYPDGQMLVYQEGVEALMSNANLIMNASASYFSDYVPVMGTVLSPYLYDSREIWKAASISCFSSFLLLKILLETAEFSIRKSGRGPSR